MHHAKRIACLPGDPILQVCDPAPVT